MSQQEESIEPRSFEIQRAPEQPASEYRDVACTALFGVNVLVLSYFAFIAGGASALHRVANEVLDANTANDTSANTSFLSSTPAHALFLVTPLVTVTLCLTYLGLLRRYAAVILKWTLLGAVAFNAVAGIVLLIAFASFGGLGFLLAAAMSYWYYTWVRRRLEFASCSLQVASSAIDAAPTTMFVPCLFIVAQLAYVLLWATAMCGIHEFGESMKSSMSSSSSSSPSPSSPSTGSPNAPTVSYTGNQPGGRWAPAYGADWSTSSDVESVDAVVNTGYALLVLSLLWGVQICQYLTHVTVAGVVSWWWYRPGSGTPVRTSLRRAVTKTFGSVAFGALVVAGVRTLIWAMERAKRRRATDTASRVLGSSHAGRAANILGGGGGHQCQGFMMHVGACLLRLVRRLVEYATVYAFPRCAIWGEDFATAGSATIDMFKSRGYSAMLNDRLLSRILLFGGFVSSLLASGVAGSFTSMYGGTEDEVVGVSIAAGALAMAIAIVFNSVIEGAVISTFVLFSSDPETLSRLHPTEFASMSNAWEMAAPQGMKGNRLFFSPYRMGGMGMMGGAPVV